MLESLEQSNIKKMSVESPEEQKVLFDPEKDITEADREKINALFMEYRSKTRTGSENEQSNDRNYLTDIAYRMQELGIPFEMSEDDKTDLEINWTRYREGKVSSGFTEKTFFMEKLGFPIELTESDKKMMENEALHVRHWRGGRPTEVATLAHYMNELGIKFDLTKKEKQYLKKYFQEPRSDQDLGFASIASHVAYMPDLSVELSAKDQKEIRAQLESVRQKGHFWPFIQLATAMNILSKSSKPELSYDALKMPEQKQF